MSLIQEPIFTQAEYTFPAPVNSSPGTSDGSNYLPFGDFIPNLALYPLPDGAAHPGILILPGGGYAFTSNREGEIVAEAFNALGFHTFVLTYTVNPLQNTPLKLQPLKDASRAVRYLRKNAERFHLIPDRLAILGFSAGAHLAGSLLVHSDSEALAEAGDYNDFSNLPDAGILCYPVITSGEHAHRGSFDNLLGTNASDEELAYMSLENHVTEATPPIFLWHTLTDESVPVENSFLMEAALRRTGVRHEMHLFNRGGHGLSLANDAWLHCGRKGDYTYEPFFKAVESALSSGTPLPPPYEHLPSAVKTIDDFKELYFAGSEMIRSRQRTYPEIAVWPTLAAKFLNSLEE